MSDILERLKKRLGEDYVASRQAESAQSTPFSVEGRKAELAKTIPEVKSVLDYAEAAGRDKRWGYNRQNAYDLAVRKAREYEMNFDPQRAIKEALPRLPSPNSDAQMGWGADYRSTQARSSGNAARRMERYEKNQTRIEEINKRLKELEGGGINKAFEITPEGVRENGTSSSGSFEITPEGVKPKTQTENYSDAQKEAIELRAEKSKLESENGQYKGSSGQYTSDLFRRGVANQKKDDKSLGYDVDAMSWFQDGDYEKYYNNSEFIRWWMARDESKRGTNEEYRDWQDEAALLDSTGGRFSHLEYLTNEELQDVFYILHKQGPEEVDQFLTDMKPTLDARADMEDRETIENAHPMARVLGNVLSVPANVLLSPVSLVGNIEDLINTGKVNPNNSYNIARNFTENVRGTSANKLNEAAGNKEFLGVSLGDVYQSGMSTADSALGMLTTGGAYTVLMGMSAAASSMEEAAVKDLPTWQAVGTGLVAGLVEYFTEKVSLETFLNNFMSGNAHKLFSLDTLKNIGLQGLAEASEEMASEILNAAADVAINGDRSEILDSMYAHIREGYNPNQALGMAFGEKALDVWKAGAGGLLSGGMMGVGGATINSSGVPSYSQIGNQIIDNDSANILRGLAADLASEESGIALGDKAAKKITRAAENYDKRGTARSLGKLATTVQGEVAQANSSEITNAVKKAGLKGEDANRAETIFNILAETPNFELSDEDAAFIQRDDVFGAYDKLFGQRGSADAVSRYTNEGWNTLKGAVQYGQINESQEARTVRNARTEYAFADKGVRTEPSLPGVGKKGNEVVAEAKERGVDIEPVVAAYNQGVKGEELTVRDTKASPEIGENIQKQAYNAGVLDAATEKANVERYGKAVANENPGLDMESVKNAGAKYTSGEIRRADALGKVTGSRVEIVKDLTDEKGNPVNALYDANTGTIKISAKATSPFTAALSHETVHRIRDVSEDAYKSLKRFVIANMSKEKLTAAMGVRGVAYGTFDEDFVSEETVADAFGDILDADPSAIDELVKDDRKLGEKIRDIIRDLIIKIDRYLNRKRDLKKMTAEERKAWEEERTEFAELRKKLVQAESRFSSALNETVYSLDMQEKIEDAGMGGDEKTVEKAQKAQSTETKAEVEAAEKENKTRNTEKKAASETLETNQGAFSDYIISITQSKPTKTGYRSTSFYHISDEGRVVRSKGKVYTVHDQGILTRVYRGVPWIPDGARVGVGAVKYGGDIRLYDLYSGEQIGIAIFNEPVAVNYEVLDWATRMSNTGSGLLNELADKARRFQNAIGQIEEERARKSGVGGVHDKPEGVRFSRAISPEDSARYLELAKDPEENDAELDRMVEHAARAAGYDSPKLYHGTKAFGFTAFDKGKLDDGFSIFLTSDREIARTYSGDTEKYRMTEFQKPKKLVGEELLSEAKRVLKGYDEYELLSDEDRKSEIKSNRGIATVLSNEVKDKAGTIKEFVPALSFDSKTVENRWKEVYNALDNATTDAEQKEASKKYEEIEDAQNIYNLYDLYRKISTAKTADEIRALQDKVLSSIVALLQSKNDKVRSFGGVMRSQHSNLNTYLDQLRDYLEEDDVYVKRHEFGTYRMRGEYLRDAVERAGKKGIYEMYGKGGKQLVVECDGANWNSITPPAELNLKKKYVRTREITRTARLLGYDSVVFKDVVDSGGQVEYEEPSDVYVFFNPEQVKSADPVTYDSSGNIIPLSERFNENNDDIRYSRRISAEESKRYLDLAKDPEANEAELSRMVEEAAEKAMPDSKIRLPDGKLRKVYHGTNNNNFTVFDPKKIGSSTDLGWYGRGFYFAYTSGEASYYGDKIISAYLDIKKPYNFEKELATYKGQDTSVVGDLAAFAINLSGKFPQIASNLDITVYEWSGDQRIRKKISFPEYANQVLAVFNDKKLRPFETTDRFGNRVYSYAYGDDLNISALRSSYKSKEYAEKNRLDAAASYVNWKIFDEIDGHTPEHYMQGISRAFTDKIKELGYDGIIQSAEGDEAIAFSSSQIKSADPVTYDADGNVIPLEERFNPENEDIRYSRDLTQSYEEYNKKYGSIPPGERPFRDVAVPERTAKDKKVAQTVRTVLEAEATPETMVPTIKEMIADGDFSYDVYTDEAALANAEADIKKAGFTDALTRWTRAVARGKVNKTITAEGWALYNAAATAGNTEAALTILRNMVGNTRSAAQALQAVRILKKMSPEAQLYNVVKTVDQLIKDAKDRYGRHLDITVDPDLAEDFLNARSQEERDRILQKIYKVIAQQLPTRFIDRWNSWRYLSMLGNPRTHIRNIAGNALFAPIVMTKNAFATGIEAVVSRASGGKLDRTKANIVGRQGAALLSAARADYTAIQDEALGERKYSDASQQMVSDIEKYRPRFGGSKWKVWNKTGGAALDWLNRKNSEALDKEDVWFSRPHYAVAMAQYCKAHGITAEQIRSGKGLDAARAYAIKEAQKATYRDTNVFSQAVSRLGRKNTFDNKFERVGKTLVEGILPFRKTPANILARGVEYSPLGLMKSITTDIAAVRLNTAIAMAQADDVDIRIENSEKSMRRAYVRTGMDLEDIAAKTGASLESVEKMAKTGEWGAERADYRAKLAKAAKVLTPMTGAEMIDHLSAGLTGTGLVALGAVLASFGLIRGHGKDDDKEEKFDQLTGHQNYALELPNGVSITLDWLAPESLPFFVGVNLFQEWQDKDQGSLEDLLTAIGNTTEPFIEMSCLQSLNDLLDSIGYAKSKGMASLPSILVSMATSYISQGIPTIGGQTERTIEDKRMTTFTDKKGAARDLQYQLGKASAKIPIPGVEYNQIPYIDAWGREESTGILPYRAFSNFVNPAYVKQISADEVEQELLWVYEGADKDGGVFPSRAEQSFTVNGQEFNLNAQEFVKYATVRGQTSYETVGMLTKNDAYRDLPDADKAAAIKDAYSYATVTARTTVGAPYPTSSTYSWVPKAAEANRRGITPDVYILVKNAVSNNGGIPGADGKTIDNSKGLLTMEYIYGIPGLTNAQKRYLFDVFNVGKKVIGYSQSQVESALKEMRGK